jgi:hypothetical protein
MEEELELLVKNGLARERGRKRRIYMAQILARVELPTEIKEHPLVLAGNSSRD